MNGVVTKLGFTLWAKNLTKRAFGELHRDLVKTRVLSNAADGSFRRFIRNMNRETRAARGFGVVLTTAVLAPLAGAGGVFAGAAAGIAGVGAAMAGAMTLGMVAYDKFTKFAEGTKSPLDRLKEQGDQFMREIAPAFEDAWVQMDKVVQRLFPVAVELFKELGKFTGPFIEGIGGLLDKVLPSVGRLFEAVGPHIKDFISSFGAVADLIDNVALSLDKLAPSLNPIVTDLFEIVSGILGPDFFGALSPLLDGLHGFFNAAKPGFFKFLEDFAVALNNLAPVLPALGEFLSQIFLALGPLLITVSESLAEHLPEILSALGGFVEFLGKVLDNRAVVDTLLGIAAAYMAIAGALKAVTAAMAVTTMLSFGTVPGGGGAPAGAGKKPGAAPAVGPNAPKPPSKLSAGWHKWATKFGTLLGGAIRAGILLGIVLWAADEAATANGSSIGNDFLGIRKKFNQTYKDKGFWRALWGGIKDEMFPEIIFGNPNPTRGTGTTGSKDPNAGGGQTLTDDNSLLPGGYKRGKGIQSDPTKPKWLRDMDRNVDSFFDGLGQKWSTFWDRVFTKSAAAKIFETFKMWKQNLDIAWENMQAWLSRAGENVKTWLMNMGKNISGTVDNITQWFQNLSKNVSGGVANAVVFLQNLGTNIRRTWNNVVTFLKKIFFGIGPWLLQYVVMPIKNFFTQTIPHAAGVLKDKVGKAWQHVLNKLGAARDWIKKNIVDKIGAFFTKTIPNAAMTMAEKVKNAFNKAKNWVGEVWNKLGNVVRGPVNWVITNVYNKGIRAVWNKVAGAVGATKLGAMATIGNAPKADGRSAAEKTRDLLNAKSMVVGGPVSGGPPGIDTVPAWLNNGEHVLTTEEVNRAGGHNAILKFRSALMNGRPVQGGNKTGMFKDGGFWDKAMSIPGKLLNNDFVRGALGSVASPVLDLLEKTVSGMSDKPAFSGMMKKIALKPLDWIRSFISKDDAKHSSLMDDGSGLYNAMFKWIKARVPGTQLRSGLRPGDPGYHGSGKAVDLGFSDRSEFGPGMRGMAGKAFGLIKKTFKPNIAELIWDFAGSKAVWNGSDHFFTGPSAGPGTHADHIHWAMARAASGIQPLGGTASGYKGGSASAWRGVVNGVLNELGLSRSDHAGNVLRAIQKESGGNPRAINNWDSNAAAGIPSKGLLQTIDPTFNAWAGKYKSRGVYDPYANVYAAVRYARNRYGAGWSARMAQPGGYKGGTASAARGWKMVGENGPEPVYFHGAEKVKKAGSSVGGDVTIHVHGDVNDARIFEDKVVKAVHEAQRHGRIKK